MFLGGFQADGLDEIVECLNDRGISTIEGGDLFFWDRSVSGKGLQNAGSQWSIDFFIKLQEHHTDLITARNFANAPNPRFFPTADASLV